MFDLAPLDGPVPADRVEGSLMTDPVAVLNPKLPATVDASSDLATVVRMMIERGVGAVLVTINERELAGILTDRDFLTKVAGRSGFEGLPVREFMTPNPETVSLTDPLAFAVRKMAAGGYRHLPVVVDKKAVGLISIRDVLQHVTTLCRDV
jgi:CBS domain-containing protein